MLGLRLGLLVKGKGYWDNGVRVEDYGERIPGYELMGYELRGKG